MLMMRLDGRLVDDDLQHLRLAVLRLLHLLQYGIRDGLQCSDVRIVLALLVAIPLGHGDLLAHEGIYYSTLSQCALAVAVAAHFTYS